MLIFLRFIQVVFFIPAVTSFTHSTKLKLNHGSRLNIVNRSPSGSSLQNDLSGRGSVVLSMAVPAADVKIRTSEMNWMVVPDIWESMAKIIPDKVMLVDPVHGDRVDLTYAQGNNLITTGAAAMQKLGLQPDECVSIFSENSYKWLIADQAVMKSGACNSVRGALAPTEELHYIYEDSKSVGLIVESPNLLQQLFSPTDSDNNLAKSSISPRFAIVLFSRGMNGTELAAAAGVPSSVNVLSYEEWLASASKEEFKSVPRDPKYVLLLCL